MREQVFLRACLVKLSSWLVLWLVTSASGVVRAQTGTAPEEGIRSRPSQVILFRQAHIVVSPERELERADLLVRDGKISDIGSSLTAPADALIIDCLGKYLYPAFIDPLVEQTFPAVERPDTHWNSHVQAHRDAAHALPTDDRLAGQYRRAGFGSLLVAASDGIFKGSSAIVTTAKLPVAQTTLRTQVFQHMALVLSRGERGGYPNSPMGVVALVRQTLSDAQWYQQSWQAFRADPALPAPDRNAALEALAPLVRGQQMAMIDAGNELYALRADRLAREFSLKAVLRGSGREYRRLDAVAETGRTVIVPVDFPRAPDVSTIDAAANVSLQALMHWYLAPENPGRLHQAGVDFVLTANGLTSPSDLLDQVRKAIARGLPAEVALAALTSRTAALLEIDHLVGTLERGKLANLLIASGPLWEKKTKLEETWVQGERYAWQNLPRPDASGNWQVELTGPNGFPKQLTLQLEDMTDKAKGRIGLPKATTEKASSKKATEEPSSTDKTGEGKPPAQSTEAKAKRQKPKEDSQDEADEEKSSKQQPVGDGAGEKTVVKATKSSSMIELKPLVTGDLLIDAQFDASKLETTVEGTARISLTLLTTQDQVDALIGRITWSDGSVSSLRAVRSQNKSSTKSGQPSSKKEPDKEAAKDSSQAAAQDTAGKPAQGSEKGTEQDAAKDKVAAGEGKPATDQEPVCDVNYPLGAYGVTRMPEQPEWLLVRGATLWTCDQQGRVDSGDLLIHRGVIHEVGRDLKTPEGALVIDARGKHVSPGIIDCHSHMATDGGVNESGQAVTAEVRIGDFIDSNDQNIYLQLAGGVTTANVLHGSANPIGGQNQVIKLRWGALDEQLKMREAPAGIKFALGENVKQSNWGERASGRYPQSRMGVEQIMRDRFEAAKLYRAAQAKQGAAVRGLPVRRDYELEAIAEILEHKRWVHCHSYRQDEILTFLRLLEEYGVTVGSLQHILEGYKVADVMARHGATGSTFSDWWNYKFEVVDAIPYNAALMHRAGVVVSLNSDDDELARHLNHEAAKAVKYGGVPPEEALKFVTLNAAKQLRIDAHVGSLAVGKQADFVIWSSSPLSTLSRCEQTWIDGRKYFDRQADAEQRQQVSQLHRRLVQRVLDSNEKMSGDGRDRRDPSLWFVRYDEFCNHKHGHDEDEHDHQFDRTQNRQGE